MVSARIFPAHGLIVRDRIVPACGLIVRVIAPALARLYPEHGLTVRDLIVPECDLIARDPIVPEHGPVARGKALILLRPDRIRVDPAVRTCDLHPV